MTGEEGNTDYNPIAIDVMGVSNGVIEEIVDCGDGLLVCAGVSGSQVEVEDEDSEEGILRASTNEECAYWTLQLFSEEQFDLRQPDLPLKVSQWLMAKSKEIRTLADQVLDVIDDRDVDAIRNMIEGSSV